MHSFFAPRNTQKKRKKVSASSTNTNVSVSKKEDSNTTNTTKDMKENKKLVESIPSSTKKVKVNSTSSSSSSSIPIPDDIDVNLTIEDADYDPQYHLPYNKDIEHVPYSFMASLFELCESTEGRLVKIQYMANYFRSIISYHKDELLASMYLSVNQIYPDYEGTELGIGEKILIDCIAENSAMSIKSVKEYLKQCGDLGDIAATVNHKQVKLMFVKKPKPLTVIKVFSTFKKIAAISGKDSSKRKKNLIKQLLSAATSMEARYIIRALQGNLRIKVQSVSVLAALAKALVETPIELNNNHPDDSSSDSVPPKRQKGINYKAGERFNKVYSKYKDLIKQAMIEVPNYDKLIEVLLQYPVESIAQHMYLTPGIPIKPMLGKPAKSIQDLIDKFGQALFTCEYKYDGERAQIHKLSNGQIKIFSRNSENITTKYPDIIASLPKAYKNATQLENFIIDCESVAFDVEKKSIVPFQVLSTRKRKNVDDAIEKVIPVKAGWKDGTKVTFEREGNDAPNSEPGDITFVIVTKPHAHFKREGDDLIYTCNVTLQESLCGVHSTVQTLDGRTLPIQAYSVTPETTLRLANEGMMNCKSKRRGDLLVNFLIKFPILSDSQRQQIGQIIKGGSSNHNK